MMQGNSLSAGHAVMDHFRRFMTPYFDVNVKNALRLPIAIFKEGYWVGGRKEIIQKIPLCDPVSFV